MHVHTSYGPGEVVDRDSVRGRTQFLVAGRGFRVWVDEADVRVAASPLPDDTTDNVDEDNSVTLPYNPEPQHPAGIFGDQSTILPGEYTIDAEDRTHPADSLSFDERAEDDGPGPDPKLFAGPAPWEKSAAFALHYAGTDDLIDEAEDVIKGFHGHGDEPQPKPEHLDDEPLPLPVSGHTVEHFKDKAIDESPLGAILDPLRHLVGASYDEIEAMDLGPKFAKMTKQADRNDPAVRFREDPYAEIIRHGSTYYEISPATEEYGLMVEADRSLRYAAWADVRRKAKRLRQDGQVDVKDIAPDRIYASVKGDHGIYDVMVKKGSEFGGFGHGQSVADYSCNCEWGRWAFKRQYKFVGRMCSHALAAYNEMQSQYLKDNHREHFKRASITAGVFQDFKEWAESVGAETGDIDAASEFVEANPDLTDDEVENLFDHVVEEDPERREIRDYTDPLSQNWPDYLDTVPSRMEPDLIFPAEEDEGDRSEFVSLDDDRKTTGPDQIVASYRTADENGGGGYDPRPPSNSVGPGGTPHTPETQLPIPAMVPPALQVGPYPAYGSEAPDRIPGMIGQIPGLGVINSIPGVGLIPHTGSLHYADDGSGLEKYFDTMTNGQYKPSTPGLKEDPFAGGGFDATKLPGVSGSPNSSAPTDPTGGMLSGPISGPGQPTAPGATSPSVSNATQGTSGGSAGAGSAGTGSGGGAGTGGGGWKANDIAENSIKPGEYEIKSGDTLAEIARGSGYGDNYQALADANGIADPNKINAGDKITIGTPGQSTPAIPEGAIGADFERGNAPDVPELAPGAPDPLADTATPSAGAPAAGDTNPTPNPLTAPTTPPPPGAPDPGTTGAGWEPPISNPPTTNPTSDMTNPGLTPGGVPDRVSSRYFFAEDFEDEPGYRTAADSLATDPAEPGVAGNGSLHSTLEPAPSASGTRNDPAEPGVAGNQGPAGGGAGGLGDLSSALGVIGPVVQSVSGIAQPLVQGVTSLLGGGGLGSIFAARYASMRTADLLEELRELSSEPIKDSFGSTEERNDEVRYVVQQLRDRGYDVSQFVANKRTAEYPDGTVPGPIGPRPQTLFQTSESYVEDNERPDFQDVDDCEGDVTKPRKGADKPQQKKGRRLAKTAGRKFTLAEQRELEEESHPLGARNKPTRADLAGTHYLAD